MKNCKFILTIVLFAAVALGFSQENQERKKIKISGSILDKNSNQPLEYATVTFINAKNPKAIFGGITDNKGTFNVEATAGMYTVKIEFMSYKAQVLNQKLLKEDTNLGTFVLQEDVNQLQEVVVRSEKTTVEIKLDKKVYNLGKDLMVKGGTVTDILDNIPSVSVDAEGTISLRGNDNVRILIDGKPSNANNIIEALKLIPADAVDKVEVITNPSARYDAEGGGGILNIVLKKGKTNGLNGSLIATIGNPKNSGFSGNFNYKSTNFNLFSTIGYADRTVPGNANVATSYLSPTVANPSLSSLEDRTTNRFNKVSNGTFGAEWFLSKNATWTNSIIYQKKNGQNLDQTFINYTFINAPSSNQSRTNNEDSNSEGLTFSSNLVQKFKKEGHKLTADFQTSFDKDRNLANIFDTFSGIDFTKNFQDQNRNLFQADYVLPFGKNSQFEVGYRGDFINQTTNVRVLNNNIINTNFTFVLEYLEKVNAFYTQYGTKLGKFSFLGGLRLEDSNIDVNRISENQYLNRKYRDFFPSAFITYEISDKSSVSLSYSKRISRPRGRQLNPFNNYSSNINIFQGNVFLLPAYTNAIDFGYIKRWEKLTLNTSLYVNRTNDVFQFIRKPSGVNTSGTPVIISTPINLDYENRLGFEFTLNYSPYKWWKLNSNFNFFRVQTVGEFSYVNIANQTITRDFGNTADAWFTRLTSKVSLPYKIDWQTNATYNGPQTNGQGVVKGVYGVNLAFSKDILKDKGTLALSVNDLFNSRKRYWDTNIANAIDASAVRQERERQITLSFTYRFNKSKNEKEKPRKQQQEGGDDFQG